MNETVTRRNVTGDDICHLVTGIRRNATQFFVLTFAAERTGEKNLAENQGLVGMPVILARESLLYQ